MVKGRLKKSEKEIIIKLRSEGRSYSFIADTLGCEKERVQSWCRKNGYGGFKTDHHNDPSNAFDHFIKRLEEKTSGAFVYKSGFKNSDSVVTLACKVCGTNFEKNAQFVRKAKEIRPCETCKERERLEECKRKREREVLKQKARSITQVIKKIIKEKEKENKLIKKHCLLCGDPFTTNKKSGKFCSINCMNRYHNTKKEVNRREVIKNNGKVDYSVNLKKLIERDESLCSICGHPVDVFDYRITKQNYFIAGNLYPSIDHILPVSKGGTHTWDNVQLAHRKCNARKSNDV